ncbi:hypothetical protein ALO50_101659 [Pseudomonas syringae pv. cerasicola]|uniref:Uncharacterized protein n=2 Tax=Pseudomonas syringae group TaxID=136849 RepID=A0A0P9N587_PSESX|nr:hypothetical protein ALO50_101659 [Pseudomonas syringae pv. cerasicola]RMS73456.1 hypothetical protein ALP61_100265 [Pseudomonas savastanoi]RMS87657.1 hypothetical protein ALP60_101503 [Pseudomonas savastanoi]RMT46352.1 hypothetical protein ALP47_101520 [Pseudomonas savastanoi]
MVGMVDHHVRNWFTGTSAPSEKRAGNVFSPPLLAGLR